MTRIRYDVLLSIGSNIAPDESVPRALALLEKRFHGIRVSPVYTCPAVDTHGEPDPDTPAFLNLAVRCTTDLPATALREACRFVEEQLGRVRTDDRFAPRTLDLDPVFGDAEFLKTSGGALPAPELTARAFVLVPAADVWPDAVVGDDPRSLAAWRDALPARERGMLRRRSSG